MGKVSIKQKIVLIIFGLIICAVLIEVSLRIGGYVILSIQEYRNQISLNKEEEYRILCLGESTTALQWPILLESILNQSDTEVNFSVIDKGVPSTNTGAIITHLRGYLDKYEPHMVVAMMGINDDGNSFVLPYEEDRTFFESLKIYKLLRILKQYIFLKFKELRFESGEKYEEEIESKKNMLNKNAYRDLNQNCLKGEKLDKTDLSFKKSLEVNKKNADRYIELGWEYIEKGEFDKAEKIFKKIILGIKNEDGYIGLGQNYLNQEKFEKAETIFKKSLEINSYNEDGYRGLGESYMGQEKFNKAEELFKKAINIDKKTADGYIGLGGCYLKQGKFNKAEIMFRKTLEMNSNNEDAYIGLGKSYIEQGKFNRAKEMFRKVIEIDPENEDGYSEIGWCYLEQEKFNKAEGMFRKVIEMDPENEDGYIGLGRFYIEQGKFNKAKEMFRKAIKINPRNNYVIHYLTKCKQLMLNSQKENEKEAILGFYFPRTVTNYQRLEEILSERGIKLVCVQYPMLSIEPLKKIFKDQKREVIFVDNEKIFKDAVDIEGYEVYFEDNFADDFGHCTSRGNRLLANNIANVILEKAFKK